MGCLDEAEKLTQEICTIGIRANRVTFNELLHARAFASAGAGGRPWSMIPSAASGLLDRGRAGASSLIPLPPPREDDGFPISWDHVTWSPPDEWCREWSFRGEERGPRLPPWAEGWLHSWFLRGAQLCVVTDSESAELSRPRATGPVGPSIDFMGLTLSLGGSTVTRACGTRQRALPCHAAAREESFPLSSA